MEAEVNPFSPETRALIDAAGDADRPTPDERARVREALIARLGIGAAVVGAAVAVTNGAAAAKSVLASSAAGASVEGGGVIAS